MKCPACDKELTPTRAANLTLDVCNSSCGGVWFDAGEFEMYDETDEKIPVNILRPMESDKIAVVDRNKIRNCPRCESTALEKRFKDGEYELEVDQCPKCTGIWLDVGELKTIREENSSTNERTGLIDDYLSQANTGKLPENQVRGLKAVLSLLFR